MRKPAEWLVIWQGSYWIYFDQYPVSDRCQQQMFGEEAEWAKHTVISSLSKVDTGRLQRSMI